MPPTLCGSLRLRSALRTAASRTTASPGTRTARGASPRRRRRPSGTCQRDDTVSRDFAACVSRMSNSSSSQFGALLRRAKMYTSSEAAMIAVT